MKKWWTAIFGDEERIGWHEWSYLISKRIREVEEKSEAVEKRLKALEEGKEKNEN